MAQLFVKGQCIVNQIIHKRLRNMCQLSINCKHNILELLIMNLPNNLLFSDADLMISTTLLLNILLELIFTSKVCKKHNKLLLAVIECTPILYRLSLVITEEKFLLHKSFAVFTDFQ